MRILSPTDERHERGTGDRQFKATKGTKGTKGVNLTTSSVPFIFLDRHGGLSLRFV